MTRLCYCPVCRSTFENIRGVVFPVGSYEGRQCDDGWHTGKDYDVLALTSEDEALLKKARIAV